MAAACSPACLLVLLAALHIFLSQDSNALPTDLVFESFKKIDFALKYAVSNEHLNVWTFPIISLVIVPIWFILALLSSPLRT